MSDSKKIHIISGGTISHITPHLGLTARAYGNTGRALARLCAEQMPTLDALLHRTRMAGGNKLETNDDVEQLINKLKADASTKIIFMPVALCDFDVVEATRTVEEMRDDMPYIRHVKHALGKDAPRLKTSEHERLPLGEYDSADTLGEPSLHLALVPAKKIIPMGRDGRKDIFLVGFKTTSGATEDEQYIAGLNLLKGASCNLVLANDLKTRVNMIITPEEARYHVTRDRETVLRELVDMTKLRSHLTFTRSTVIAGEPVSWTSNLVPASLRRIVNHCIEKNAYKPFRGATVGHFAVKISDNEFLTSQRKTNFNDLHKLGLVRIKTDGPDTVLAYGAKPSVGGQSQRIVFSEHPEYDCIVHFHCPLRQTWDLPSLSDIPVVSQREYECGSHQCGQNTSRGLKKFGNLSCVMLDQHGPNIVFNHSIDPDEVINFIDANFDLNAKTGGYVTLGAQS
jgi:hypothetical protein